MIQSAVLGGAFFTVCAYTEVLGFRTAGQDLGSSPAPMHVIAGVAGVPILGLLIDIGALVSMFAGTLACITAAARVLLLMAHNGLAHGSLRTTHARNETPSFAVAATGIAAVLPVVVLALRGATGLDVYGWLGSLATTDSSSRMASFASRFRVFAQSRRLRSGARIISALAGLAMLLALAGNLYPVPKSLRHCPTFIFSTSPRSCGFSGKAAIKMPRQQVIRPARRYPAAPPAATPLRPP